MVWITEEELETFAHSFCMPVTLIINFSLFQYLATIYYKRRRELRGALLLFSAFCGFATLIPFAYPDDTKVGHLNDISETCSTLTFLIQIAMIGRDINKKVKIPALKYMTYGAEALVLFGLFVVVQNVIEVMFPSVHAIDGLDNIMEDVGLWFIFAFRFTMLAMARGYRFIFEHKKMEIVMYLLFVTHEHPFTILENSTGLPWEDVQALWNRLTIALCVALTIQEKIRSNSSKLSKMATSASKAPSMGAGAHERPTVRMSSAIYKSAKSVLALRATVKPTTTSVLVGPRQPTKAMVKG